MNHHRKIATVVGGLTVFTAALFAQNTPASTSASGAVNSAVTTPVTPPSTPVVPQVGSPAATGAASSATTATSAGTRIDNSPKPRTDTSVNTGASTNGVLNANRSSPSTSGKVGSDAAANSAVRTSPSTFMALDTNGDGRVSSSEYSASLSQRVDANGNVAVNADGTASAAMPAEKRGWWSRTFNRNKDKVDATSNTGVSASSNPSFAQLDANGDGYLSSEEVEVSRGHDKR